MNTDPIILQTELLDSFAEELKNTETEASQTDDTVSDRKAIGFRDATFTWSDISGGGTMTPRKGNFSLHIENELLFQRGRVNVIIGPTGSGKTSLLMAMLGQRISTYNSAMYLQVDVIGEMHFIRSSAKSWFNLPTDGGVAYAAQESWIQNQTIKVCYSCLCLGPSLVNTGSQQNIVFGATFDEKRYKKGKVTSTIFWLCLLTSRQYCTNVL